MLLSGNNYAFFFFFLVKRAGRHFGFFKRAGRHEKGAGRHALQKKPRQNTAICFYQETTMCVFIFQKVLLDPIFMILRCELFTHFGSCLLKRHDVSTSQLEAMVT